MKALALVFGVSLLANSLVTGAESRVPAAALAFSPRGTQLLVGAHGEIRVHSVDTGKLEQHIPCEFPKISAFAFSTDATTLAVSGGTPGVGGGVILLDWPNRKVVGHLTNHADVATAAAFNPAATLLASTGADSLVHVFSWPAKTPAYRIEGHSGPVLAVAFSPDNELLVTASADRSVKVWEAATGKLRRSFSHHTDIVHCLTFRPQTFVEGQPVSLYCATGSQDKTVRVWQPAIGRMVRIVRGHEGPVFAVAYNADGSRLYSAGKEGIVRVIDADSDQILHSWAAHDDWIYGLAISRDGRMLATGDWKGTVKLWDGREVVPKLQREIK
ncbi:MAG TPA: hypothetical protein VJW76_11040 [Verrucomicrobiae bacterium]|nr:hypothetical protein [Verrucomicrobiae bacterium]